MTGRWAADEHDILVTVASKVSAARRARGWTQMRLAEVSGVRVATLRDLERARFNVTVLTLLKIADALESGLDALVRRSPP